jgi:hypothetical protein
VLEQAQLKILVILLLYQHTVTTFLEEQVEGQGKKLAVK